MISGVIKMDRQKGESRSVLILLSRENGSEEGPSDFMIVEVM